MPTEAYPALFVVPKTLEDDDGVHRPADCPTEDEVLAVVNEALERWSPSDMVVDVRRGERLLQEEYPPADPIEVEGVTVVFGQVPAPEAEGYYDGPFQTAKLALGRELPVEVWIDAVARETPREVAPETSDR